MVLFVRLQLDSKLNGGSHLLSRAQLVRLVRWCSREFMLTKTCRACPQLKKRFVSAVFHALARLNNW